MEEKWDIHTNDSNANSNKYQQEKNIYTILS